MIIKSLITILLSSMILQASLLDFRQLKEAKRAYQEGNYSHAIEEFQQVERRSDELLYDTANSYYKEGNYTQAQSLYAQIQKPELAFKKWHNLGNSYAQLGKLDKGIHAYEEALKIKEDKDTRFNLELLKKKKKEQEKKRQQKNKDQKKQNQKNKDQKDRDKNQENQKSKEKNQQDKQNQQNKNDKGQNQKEQDKKSDQEKKEKDKKNNEKKKDNAEQKEKSDSQRQKEQAQAMKAAKKEPISDKEMRKYQKMLDQRGINTLMLPITNKGDKNEEIKPW